MASLSPKQTACSFATTAGRVCVFSTNYGPHGTQRAPFFRQHNAAGGAACTGLCWGFRGVYSSDALGRIWNLDYLTAFDAQLILDCTEEVVSLCSTFGDPDVPDSNKFLLTAATRTKCIVIHTKTKEVATRRFKQPVSGACYANGTHSIVVSLQGGLWVSEPVHGLQDCIEHSKTVAHATGLGTVRGFGNGKVATFDVDRGCIRVFDLSEGSVLWHRELRTDAALASLSGGELLSVEQRAGVRRIVRLHNSENMFRLLLDARVAAEVQQPLQPQTAAAVAAAVGTGLLVATAASAAPVVHSPRRHKLRRADFRAVGGCRLLPATVRPRPVSIQGKPVRERRGKVFMSVPFVEATWCDYRTDDRMAVVVDTPPSRRPTVLPWSAGAFTESAEADAAQPDRRRGSLSLFGLLEEAFDSFSPQGSPRRSTPPPAPSPRTPLDLTESCVRCDCGSNMLCATAAASDASGCSLCRHDWSAGADMLWCRQCDRRLCSFCACWRLKCGQRFVAVCGRLRARIRAKQQASAVRLRRTRTLHAATTASICCSAVGFRPLLLWLQREAATAAAAAALVAASSGGWRWEAVAAVDEVMAELLAAVEGIVVVSARRRPQAVRRNNTPAAVTVDPDRLGESRVPPTPPRQRSPPPQTRTGARGAAAVPVQAASPPFCGQFHSPSRRTPAPRQEAAAMGANGRSGLLTWMLAEYWSARNAATATAAFAGRG
eukprot:TRINITY_DN11735_c0_g1_i9.p1 TRINITY_DN11735_c0_g1~~TRINITY_DN11735_c0_g1_i9.p1  ORF type:complete len:717 (+),score=98.59 TRINITY_DN11735_c0_g1_i9:404-2554(+)